MQPSDNTTTLQQLAHSIRRFGLTALATLLLDMLRPLDVLSSQAALFCQPYIRGHQWERYATVLSEPQNWHTLRHLLQDEQNQQ
ncbi:MAG: hypothetical protein HC876_06025 [Chloroflexaceae bacterium]|nr:hypothetical protein [Chloroflexaceae bacterium]NJO05101.1 hypothetical protein [Chloroflexaceae bacterium]